MNKITLNDLDRAIESLKKNKVLKPYSMEIDINNFEENTTVKEIYDAMKSLDVGTLVLRRTC